MSRSIQERALQFHPYRSARAIALYSAIQNEVSTEQIRGHALRQGKRVFYPKIGTGDRVDFVRVRSAVEFERGRFGILEPQGEETLSDGDRSGLIVFVPGVAFDIRGNRIGRGKGWYDRILERLGEQVRSVALAYEFQVVQRLPVEQWDRRVRYIITEERTIDCGEESAPRSARLG